MQCSLGLKRIGTFRYSLAIYGIIKDYEVTIYFIGMSLINTIGRGEGRGKFQLRTLHSDWVVFCDSGWFHSHFDNL